MLKIHLNVLLLGFNHLHHQILHHQKDQLTVNNHNKHGIQIFVKLFH